MIRVVFMLDGCSRREAEEWGELIIDACRLDPKIMMELVVVQEVNPPGVDQGVSFNG